MAGLEGKRVLIVDDEADIREQLSLSLSMGTYKVKTAASGREAIEVGAHYRPNVLVTDWLLKDRIHGLHVYQALQTVDPSVQSIMITGYASRELREKADSLGVFRFIEKPFEPDHLLEAVGDAAIARRRKRRTLQLAVAEIDESGRFVYANPRARQLFSKTRAGRRATRLEQVLGRENVAYLDDRTGWVRVCPRAAQRFTWQMHGRKLPENRWLLLITAGEHLQHFIYHPVVQMLTAAEQFTQVQWPFSTRVLVLDGEDVMRRLALSLFDQAGGICHVAEGYESAIRLFQRDEGIHVLILDYDLPGAEHGAFVEKIKAIRDDVILIGSSAWDRRYELPSARVDRFMQKPWRIQDLVELLTERLDRCKGCELSLPLRKPLPGEPATRWICCGCGRPCTAIIDRNSPAEDLPNVEPAHSTQH